MIGSLPFPLIRIAGAGRLVVVYYHLVNDRDVPHVSCLYKYKNTRQFVSDLEFLIRYFAPIDLPDVIRWSKGSGSLPPNRFLLTFDDGFRECFDVIAPILLAKGIPATFFITSAFLDNRALCYQHKASLLVNAIRKGISAKARGQIKGILVEIGICSSELTEGVLQIDYRRKEALDQIGEVLQVDFHAYLKDQQPYLNSSQVSELLDKGFAIGAHSIDHPYYSTLSLDEQLEQTLVSTSCIRKSFGLNYGAFAFPHHDDAVSHEFFDKVDESGLVDITFGTNGMLDGGRRTHKQRVNLENPLATAEATIAWQYARKIYRNLTAD
jgi:peptidoglycan/xylan/chitin deacetylase (PgdA/CDA1 family)